MRNPFRREKALTGSSGVVGAIQQGWSAVPLLGGGSRQRILDIFNRAQGASYGWLYANSPAVRTVIDAIVREVGEIDLRLFEEMSDDERQPRPDHEAILSLRYPNEYTSSDSFVRSMLKDYLIHDNAYCQLEPAAGNRLSLVWIPAFMVVVQGSSLFTVDNYRVWQQGAWTAVGTWGGAGRWVDIPPENVMHWHGEHPEDPRIGLSHLDTLRGVIAEDAALQQATVELANNGLQEPAWVYRPGDAPEWSTAAARGFEEDLKNRMRRRNERPLVLEEGMEMRSFGVSPHDAEMMDLRRWAVSQIAAEYGMPAGKVGLAPATAEDESSFVVDVLKPLCKNFCRMLDQRILVRIYDWTEGRFEFNIDDRLMGDDRLRALVSASGRAVMTTNEARARLNLPPIDTGDELVTPLNVIVGENPKPSPQLMPVQDPGKPAQDGSYRTDQPPPPQASKALAKAAGNGSYEPMTPLSQLHPRRAGDMERQRRNIDVFQGVMQKHYNRLGRSLNGKALLLERDGKKAAEATDWQRWGRELSADFTKALRRTVQAEGDIYALRLAGSNFKMSEVEHYLEEMAAGAAGAINDTIRSEVEADGVDAAMARAPQHVASAGTSMGVFSTTWTREEAARQSGSYEQRVKTWIADTGRHAEWDGVTVALGEDWPSGFAPGAMPGCACSMSIS